MKISAGSLETIGSRLRTLRIKNNISTEELSNKLKIKESYIIAIESNNYDDFSSESHIRGFVRNIAKSLGMNPDTAVKIYNRDYSQPSKEPPVVLDTKPFWSKKLTYILSIIFIVLFGGIILNQLGLTNKPRLEITYPIFVDGLEEDSYALEWGLDELVLRGNIDAGNSLFVDNVRLETFGMEKFETQPVPMDFESRVIAITTKNQFGVETTLKLTVYRDNKSE